MRTSAAKNRNQSKQGFLGNRQWQLHLKMYPGIFFIVLFCLVPMHGILIAFESYIPSLGVWNSPFVGLQNFKDLFLLPDSVQALWNTVVISVYKMVFGFPVPIIFALLLNEVRNRLFKRSIQTVIYLPYFISWVILGGIFLTLLQPDGQINQILSSWGTGPINFLKDNHVFRTTLVVTDIWKGFGYGTVVYLASLSGIDPALYEAATIDGAGRWKQTLYVTLPGLMPVVILMAILNLGNVLNAGFDQIFNLYNPLVYKSSDIIDTLVYRLTFVNANYGLATAVGLLKSVVSAIFIGSGWILSYKFSDYRIF